jgi:hypothetical protein
MANLFQEYGVPPQDVHEFKHTREQNTYSIEENFLYTIFPALKAKYLLDNSNHKCKCNDCNIEIKSISEAILHCKADYFPKLILTSKYGVDNHEILRCIINRKKIKGQKRQQVIFFYKGIPYTAGHDEIAAEQLLSSNTTLHNSLLLSFIRTNYPKDRPSVFRELDLRKNIINILNHGYRSEDIILIMGEKLYSHLSGYNKTDFTSPFYLWPDLPKVTSIVIPKKTARSWQTFPRYNSEVIEQVAIPSEESNEEINLLSDPFEILLLLRQEIQTRVTYSIQSFNRLSMPRYAFLNNTSCMLHTLAQTNYLDLEDLPAINSLDYRDKNMERLQRIIGD